jgi:hypothetical protein
MHLGKTSKVIEVLTEEQYFLLGAHGKSDFAGLFVRINVEVVHG